MRMKIELRTASERLDAGEIVWLTNFSNEDEPLPLLGSADPGSNDALLRNVRVKYGEDAVVLGNAFDSETATASGIIGMIGLYVTAQAHTAALAEDSARRQPAK
jgi:hypothetical protein